MRIVSVCLAALLVVCLAVCLSGCGGATVHDRSASVSTVARPGLVYVGQFDLGAALLQSDPGIIANRPRLLPLLRGNSQETPQERVARLQGLLASDLINDLNTAGLSAGPLPEADRPTKGWLVSGDFLELNQGIRAERAVIGFGAGDSDAKLYVTLADLAHPQGQQLLNFDADTKADKSPGGGIAAVATHTPWGMLAKYALGRNTSEKDIAHVAQAIADEIVKFANGG